MFNFKISWCNFEEVNCKDFNITLLQYKCIYNKVLRLNFKISFKHCFYYVYKKV